MGKISCRQQLNYDQGQAVTAGGCDMPGVQVTAGNGRNDSLVCLLGH